MLFQNLKYCLHLHGKQRHQAPDRGADGHIDLVAVPQSVEIALDGDKCQLLGSSGWRDSLAGCLPRPEVYKDMNDLNS